MSSGVPTLNATSAAAFPSFSYLFPQPTPPFPQPFANQRIKLKRSRQRVDAGEPRNSYQASRGVQSMRASTLLGAQAGGGAGALVSALAPHPLDQLGNLFPWKSVNEDDKDDEPTDLSRKDEVRRTERQDKKSQIAMEQQKEEEEIKADTEEEKLEEERDEETPVSTGSNSSSRRKSFLPQKLNGGEEGEEAKENGEGEEEGEGDGVEAGDDADEELLMDEGDRPQLSALQSQLSGGKPLQDVLDMQRRLYANFVEQQKKLVNGGASLNNNDDKSKAVNLHAQMQKDLSRLASALKQELIVSLSGSIDKFLVDFAASEAMRALQQQMTAERPLLFPPLYQGYQGSPLMNTFNMPNGASQPGIFPSAPGFPFNSFAALNAASAALRKVTDDSPRKKRSKVRSNVKSEVVQVTDVRVSATRDSSLPDSARSSPQLEFKEKLSNYLPPTMVGHPLYGGVAFDSREDSPALSDDLSDCGPYDGTGPQSSTLTPMHLRKAKLMFFYTRYPNSSLLKSYFPDIRFNKNNTAQLVKWFSNFREFYYIQMEKFARQALAEGLRNREDIVVTTESEIYKQLNQHYNRNNHIQPPERLVYVVQETLREFFVAIQNGRDSEPSWKKTIYKIINRMDDPIPEYFKDPNFLERLE